MTRHFDIRLTGKVQGVWFRQNAQQQANRLGLNGSVRNMPDGSLEIQAEGEYDSLMQLVEWCRRGPQYAEVNGVDYIENNVQGYTDFKII